MQNHVHKIRGQAPTRIHPDIPLLAANDFTRNAVRSPSRPLAEASACGIHKPEKLHQVPAREALNVFSLHKEKEQCELSITRASRESRGWSFKLVRRWSETRKLVAALARAPVLSSRSIDWLERMNERDQRAN